MKVLAIEKSHTETVHGLFEAGVQFGVHSLFVVSGVSCLLW
jgi:hypothetical protein